MKDIERKLKKKQMEMQMKNNRDDLGQSRVGIEPRKDKTTKQKGSRSTGSETSYFVSYFGMAFHQPKIESTKIKAPEEGMIVDEENGRAFQQIVLTQQQEQHRDSVNRNRYDETQTPPTDGESDPSENSLMTGTLIKVVETSSGNSTDSGLSNESRKMKSSKIDENITDSELSPGLSLASNSNSTTKNDLSKLNEEDDESDSLQLSKSDDSQVNYGQSGDYSLRDNEDSESFHTPEQFPYDEDISTGSESEGNKNSNNSNPLTSTLASVVKFMNEMNGATILEQNHDSKDGVLDEDIRNLVQGYNNDSRRTESSFEGTRSNLENPSYFSSDDERSSTIDLSEYYDETDDDGRYSGSQQSQQRYMIQQLDSSLTMPDLAQSGSDSGDWELSSSSEDMSQQHPFDEKGRDAGKNIEKSQDRNDEEKDLIVCVFCHKDFDAKEGVRFSFDERCKHLLCESCCEEGKAAQYHGECPDCHFRQIGPRIPRNGQKTHQHRPDAVIMSI